MTNTNSVQKVKSEMEKVKQLIKTKKIKEALEYLGHNFENGETILHMATKFDEGNGDMIEAILERKPELALRQKTGIYYEGQTPLHIAITKANRSAMKLMLDHSKQEFGDELPNLLNTCFATGSQFHGTVMMHQLPLFVAALKFDIYTIEQLLHYGADVLAKNDKGDTIFHVLIHHLSLNRDKETEVGVLTMFDFFHDKLISKMNKIRDFTYMWFTRDRDGLTPLKLAARYKLISVFEFILELRDVYCFLTEGEGAFDNKIYDVTEIDSIANITHERERKQDISESVFEMMFDSSCDRQDCTEFMQLVPIKLLIQKKWKYYAIIYGLWMAVHLILMSLLTFYAVHRSTWHRNNASDIGTDIALYFESNSYGSFVLSFQWISLVCAAGYSVMVFFLIRNLYNRPNARLYWTHNFEYIVFLFGMSTALVTDLIVTRRSGRHDSMALILALICGWWFSIFFLRGWEFVSTFTVMVKNVLKVDFPRFSIIIALQLFSFTTSMHTLFQGENVPNIDGSEYNNFGRTLYIMFNVMLGLGEIEDLNQARVPWLAITLFVLFTMVTYVLLLNALLAMMSTTCDKVLEDKYSVWRLEQISVMLFLDSIISDRILRPFHLKMKIYEFRQMPTSIQKHCRYLLCMETKKKKWTTEETVTMKKSIKKEIDRTLKYILTVGTETSEILVYPDRTPISNHNWKDHIEINLCDL